jgi:hypothetical protein
MSNALTVMVDNPVPALTSIKLLRQLERSPYR